MAVRVPRDLKAQMEKLAAEERRHVSELVRELLTEGMKDRGAPIKPPAPSRSGG